MTLEEVQADVFRRLARGVADRRSPFRSPALATVGLDGRPQVRTVVLRAFDAAARRLVVHSDVRAGKIAQIGRVPEVALHVWDAGASVQVRLRGRATLRMGEAARPDWDALHPGSRATYAVSRQPGTAIMQPAPADGDRLDDAGAFAHFAALDVLLDRCDWLQLARDGQRRAQFVWGAASAEATWIVA